MAPRDSDAQSGSARVVAILLAAGRSQRMGVLPGKQRRALLAGGINFGCRNLIERHPEAVVRMEAPNPHYVQDIDTPAAYDTWLGAHSLRHPMAD